MTLVKGTRDCGTRRIGMWSVLLAKVDREGLEAVER
jgi:hypothetical protein